MQNAFQRAFGDAVYCPGQGQLHITLLDWLAPFVDFGSDKDTLFEELKAEYSGELKKVLAGYSPFDIEMSKVEMFDTCVIIKGSDDGTFQAVRDEFTSRVKMLPSNKKPPTIIHSTLIGFRSPIDMDIAKELIEQHPIDVREQVQQFRLTRETRPRLQKYQVVEVFPLLRS